MLSLTLSHLIAPVLATVLSLTLPHLIAPVLATVLSLTNNFEVNGTGIPITNENSETATYKYNCKFSKSFKKLD